MGRGKGNGHSFSTGRTVLWMLLMTVSQQISISYGGEFKTYCNEGTRTVFSAPENSSHQEFQNHIAQTQANGYYVLIVVHGLRMYTGCRLVRFPRPPQKASHSVLRKPWDMSVSRGFLQEPSHLLRNESSWVLDYVLPMDASNVTATCSQRRGSNVDIWLIDSGCNLEHESLEGRMVEAMPAPGSHFISSRDESGHGTGMASLLVGRRVGIVERAHVKCVKAVDKYGYAELPDIITGLGLAVWQRAKNNAMLNPRGSFVILSNIHMTQENREILNEAIRRAANTGVVTFLSAGNHRMNICGKLPWQSNNAIVVGSIRKDGRISRFSNHGKCINAAAPGEKIQMARTNTTALNQPSNEYKNSSGTGYSTAIVAGMLALAWDRHHMDGGARGETRAAKRLLERIGKMTKSGFLLPQLTGKCNRADLTDRDKVETIIGWTIGALSMVSLIAFVGQRCHFYWLNAKAAQQGLPFRQNSDTSGLCNAPRVNRRGDRDVKNGNRPHVTRKREAYGLWGKDPRRWKGYSPRKMPRYDEMPHHDGTDEYPGDIQWDGDVDFDLEELDITMASSPAEDRDGSVWSVESVDLPDLREGRDRGSDDALDDSDPISWDGDVYLDMNVTDDEEEEMSPICLDEDVISPVTWEREEDITGQAFPWMLSDFDFA